MDTDRLFVGSQAYLTWLANWYNDLPTIEMSQILADARGDSERVAVLAVDVTSGFCSTGPLASERVGRIVKPIVRLFERAHNAGVRHFVLPQDTHSEDAVEFGSYPAHCVRGTLESETVPELKGLPFSNSFLVIEKNSISSAIGTDLDRWLDDHPEVTTFLVAGDCTDLCVYQLAMHLRLRANAQNLEDVRVILPVDAVDTYDIPVDVAEEMAIVPHPGDFLHLVFLQSMAQNGVEVVAEVV
jgi:nicotinamidase-related amidase